MNLLADRQHPVAAAPATRPLRVLLVTQASGGGAGRHFLDLAQDLASRGVAVQGVYAPRKLDASFRARLAGGNLPPMHELAMRRAIHPLDTVDLWRLIRLIKDIGPFDIIHGHSSKGGALARLAARYLGVTTVFTPHAFVTLDPQLPAWQRQMYGRIERWLARHTSAILAVSTDEAEHARSLHIDPGKIQVVPNGIAKPAFGDRRQTRRRLGIGDRDVVFGFIGRFSRQKAPEIMLEAFEQVAGRSTRARLLMVGDGPLDEEMHRRVKASPFVDRITLLGDVVALNVITAFDVFCLSSRYEGMPYVYIEALAAGLPIVSTHVGGVSMCVEPGLNGAIVPRDHSTALANAMLPLIDPTMRQAYGQASLEKSENFTLQGMTDQILETYHRVLARRAATKGRTP